MDEEELVEALEKEDELAEDLDMLSKELEKMRGYETEYTDVELRMRALELALGLASHQDKMIYHVVVGAADAFYKYMKNGEKIGDELPKN